MWYHLLQVEQDRGVDLLSNRSLHQEQKVETSDRDLPDPGKADITGFISSEDSSDDTGGRNVDGLAELETVDKELAMGHGLGKEKGMLSLDRKPDQVVTLAELLEGKVVALKMPLLVLVVNDEEAWEGVDFGKVDGGRWFTVGVEGGLLPRVIPGPGKTGALAACETA